MEHFKFKCKLCSDGRLYAGGWCHESIIPSPLPPDELLLDDLSDIPNGDYTNYLWDGEKLIYSPVEPEAVEAPTSPVVKTRDDGTEVIYQ